MNKSDFNSEEDLPKHFGSAAFKYRRKRHTYEMKNEDIEKYFNKKYCFENNGGNWLLPDIDKMFEEENWKILDLQIMKEELNAVKSKLNDYDLEHWHKHTTITNVAGDVLWKLKNELKVELATQAWCKFYEIVASFSLLPLRALKNKYFNSFHLCEAPGAFVTSLNHYLKLYYPDVKWLWRATSLNPYYEGNLLSAMINDDRFIFQTLPNWIFGQDYTGDIMNVHNVEYLVQEASSIGEITLVTADGSVDCHYNPAEQESSVSQLHYYETSAALDILAEGGSFVLKMFTTFEASSVCLLYFLCCAFHKVHMFKPVTSKEGNSEVYVVCLEYKGKRCVKPWLRKMLGTLGSKREGKEDKVMFPLKSIPDNFIQQLLICSKMFKNLQVEAIEKNIKLCDNPSQVYHMKQVRFLIAQHFMKHYKLSSLCDETKEVVGKSNLKRTVTFNVEKHAERGSFSDRIKEKFSHWKEKLQCVCSILNEIEVFWSCNNSIQWFRHSSPFTNHYVNKGKSVDTVYSSKFCSKHLLKVWNDFLEVKDEVPDFNSYASKTVPVDVNTDFFKETMLEYNFTNGLKKISFDSMYRKLVICTSNEKTEKESFISIVNTTCNMRNGENLMFENYPLLTQFNVSVIYTLSSLFKKVGLIKPVKGQTGVIFVGFEGENNNTLSFLKNVTDQLNNLQLHYRERTVLSLVSIDSLCGQGSTTSKDNSVQGETNKRQKQEDEIVSFEMSSRFFYCVTEINNIYLKNKILSVSKEMKEL